METALQETKPSSFIPNLYEAKEELFDLDADVFGSETMEKGESKYLIFSHIYTDMRPDMFGESGELKAVEIARFVEQQPNGSLRNTETMSSYIVGNMKKGLESGQIKGRPSEDEMIEEENGGVKAPKPSAFKITYVDTVKGKTRKYAKFSIKPLRVNWG
jgi:hypothetical protein